MMDQKEIEAWVQVAQVRACHLGIPAKCIPRIAAKINAGPDCWTWTASKKQNGYGQYNTGGRNWNVHRLVYLLSGGEVEPGEELDHLCHTRECVNPCHLEPVTHAVNVRRAADRITLCPHGHEYTTENTYLWRGMRHCRACRAERNQNRSARKDAK